MFGEGKREDGPPPIENNRMITVRPAKPDDADAVARMARALSLADGGQASRFTAENFHQDGFGAKAAFHAMVAEYDGEIAGYAVTYPGYDTDSATRGVYLADLYVDSAFRRRGVGRALVVGVAAHNRDQGARWMFWSVLKRNRAARRFYKKLAVELRDVVVCAAFGQSFDALAEKAP
jgi:ribosomal protein S18 acetylase RimI-like enzyme